LHCGNNKYRSSVTGDKTLCIFETIYYTLCENRTSWIQVVLVEWRVAGRPMHIDDIIVVPSTQQFYLDHKDEVFLSVCSSVTVSSLKSPICHQLSTSAKCLVYCLVVVLDDGV